MPLHKHHTRATWLTCATLAAGLTAALPATASESYDHTIFALEHALVGVGYKLNQIDGIMDPVTEKALRDYQAKNPNLTPSGKADEPTLAALGIKENRSASSAEMVKTAGTAPAPKADPATAEKASQAAPEPEKEESRGWLFF